MSSILALALALASQNGAAATAVAIRALPSTVAGLERHWDHQTSADSPLTAFRGRGATDPLVIVAIRPIDNTGDFRRGREIAKAQPIGARIRQTLFEGRFAVPSKPDGNSFFGEYLTEKGLMQVWLFEHGGVRTLISTTIFRLEDRRRMFDAVSGELLAGATMIKEPLSAVANRKTDQ